MENEIHQHENEISLTDIWNIIKRRWLLIFLITLFFLIGSFFYVYQITPLYRSTSTLIVQTPNTYSPTAFANPFPDYYTSERWAQTYAEMLKGEPIMQEVARRIKLPRLSVYEIRQGLSVETVRNTLLLKVSFTHPMRTYAKRINDTICQAFIEHVDQIFQSNIQASTLRLEKLINQIDDEIDELIVTLSNTSTQDESYIVKRDQLNVKQDIRENLYKQYEGQKLTESQIMPSVRIFQEGTHPMSPINKRFELTMAIGLVLGLFLSMLLAFFLEYLDDTIKTEEDLHRLSSKRILGLIPHFGTKNDQYYMGKYSRYYIKS